MAKIFFSFTEPDYAVVSHLAKYLAHHGYSSWNYIDNGVPGQNYMKQINEELKGAELIIAVISENTLKSSQVESEIHHAHETNQPFLPVLIGLSHREFLSKGDYFANYLRRSTSIELREDSQPVFDKILAGIERYRILRDGRPAAEPFTYPSQEQLRRATVVPKSPKKVSASKSRAWIAFGAMGVITVFAGTLFITGNTGESVKPPNSIPVVDTAGVKQESGKRTEVAVIDTARTKQVPAPGSKKNTPSSSALSCTSGYMIVADDADDPNGIVLKELKPLLPASKYPRSSLSTAQVSGLCQRDSVKYAVFADIKVTRDRTHNECAVELRVDLFETNSGSKIDGWTLTESKVTPNYESFRDASLRRLSQTAAQNIKSKS